jgi:CBS domain-containing protein
MHVETLMTRDVATVVSETPLKEVAVLLAARRISGVPVCDRENHVVGVVSEADILVKEEAFAGGPRRPMAWLFGDSVAGLRKSGARTAGEAMTAPAVTVEPGRPISEAARIMLDRGIKRLPVVLDGELLGIVTRGDLVRAFARPDDELRREIGRDALLRRLWTHPEQASVTVEGGVVVARGEVERSSDVELVATCLRSVPGVVEVDTSPVTWLDDDVRSW